MKQTFTPNCKILFICFFLLAVKAKAQVNTQDSLALVDFYNSTNGPGWTEHKNWLTDKPVKSWEGITVINKRVTELAEYANNLSGTIPESIGNLTALQLIELGFNNLSGTLPSSIGNLVNLQSLSITFNQLSGTLPESLSNLKSLAVMELYKNQFTGQIPQSFARLTNLTNLELHFNNLTGNIPDSIFDIPSLVVIQLENNELSGPLSPSIGKLTKLQIFHLENNQFNGTIPDSICNLVLMSEMDLSNNQFTGNIPANIGNISKLDVLNLSYNQLSGKIPKSIKTLSMLDALYLQHNNLTGGLTGFKGLTYLSSLDISFNQFSQEKNVRFNRSEYPHLAYVVITNNNFTFSGLESLSSASIDEFDYSPQAIIPIHQNGSALSVSAGGTLSNNTYTWYKVSSSDSTVITGDSVFHPISSGKYFAHINNAIAAALTLKTDTVHYTMPFAQNDKEVIKITVYPNPVKDILMINGLDATAITAIQITDAAGHVYINNETKQKQGYSCNVNNLRPGNYIVTIKDNNRTQSYNFIKQ